MSPESKNDPPSAASGRENRDFPVTPDIQSTLDSLSDRGWAIEWERNDLVTCHLILFSSRRVQGSGTDATAAARAAISKLDAI